MREGANSRQPMAKAPAVGRARRPRVWDALTGREGFRGGGPWALPTATIAQAFGLKGELPFSVQNRALHEQPSVEKIWDLNTATMAQAFGLNAYSVSGVTVRLSKSKAKGEDRSHSRFLRTMRK